MQARDQLASITTFVVALAKSSLDSALTAREPREKDQYINEAKTQLDTLLNLGESAAQELRAQLEE